MEKRQTAATRQKRNQLRGLVATPRGIVVVERDDVSGLPLFGAGPTVRGLDSYALCQGEQLRPTLAPEWVIVKAGSTMAGILCCCTQNNPHQGRTAARRHAALACAGRSGR